MEGDWCNLSQLTIHGNPGSKHFIVSRETILTRLKGVCDANVCRVSPGMLVEVTGNESADFFRVRLYKEDSSGAEMWHNTEWKCNRIDIEPVSALIWKLLFPISSLEERIRLAKDKQFCKEVENFKPDSKVWYCPDLCGSNEPATYSASVKYIGPVPELGDGFYFGLDLADNLGLSKPLPLVKKYFKTSNSSGVLATLSNIQPRNTKALEAIENFEKNFLANDIQSNRTDNFFVKKSKECVNDTKSNIERNSRENCLKVIDSDNNNPIPKLKECIPVDVPFPTVKSNSHEKQNDNKNLYRNLKNFDPLNSDDEENDYTRQTQESPIPQPNTNDLSIGSYVKVLVNNDSHYGVIRWIGSPGNSTSGKLMAAIELDDIHPLATDGTYQNVRYIECSPRKAWYTNLENCYQYDMAASNCFLSKSQDIKPMQSSVVGGMVPPISIEDDLKEICGKYRGIQGHHNSCYLDATLFSMFAFTSVFDHLLFRPPNEKDCLEYEEVQRVLREEIVNPLRKHLFVGADHVMTLRTLLEKSSSISGLTSEEKDPEEFLTSLVAQTLNADPFLQLSSGQGAYHYQLFVEKDDKLTLPTVQQLLEQSFLTSNIRLKEVPSCFIIQMPRFGKSYKMYPKIQPTLLLDVTDIIENSPRQCTVCGKLAKFECRECFGQCGEGLESITFCKECLRKVHCHEKRNHHEPKALTVPMHYEFLEENRPVPRLYLELLAVVCIETSHYVSFVKCAPGPDAPWCFFDSMADRIGEQDGYNVPEMVPCPDFPYWLSDKGASYLATVTDDRLLPEHAKRLLCDGYMCMYQSPIQTSYKRI